MTEKKWKRCISLWHKEGHSFMSTCPSCGCRFRGWVRD